MPARKVMVNLPLANPQCEDLHSLEAEGLILEPDLSQGALLAQSIFKLKQCSCGNQVFTPMVGIEEGSLCELIWGSLVESRQGVMVEEG